jgi:MFS transporter, NRE family, putaive nickel resistance protein
MSTAPLPTLWRNRSFRLLFGAQVISLLGSGATTIGLALFARRLVGDASATAVLGNALTLRIVAFLLCSQPAGVLADRVNRKALLIASDVIRAGLLLLVPFATSAGHIYLLIFAINAVTAFFTPTYEASVPAVAGEAHIVQALSLSRVSVDLEAVVAPAIAGVIVALVGARWVFWFDSVTYLVSALLVVAARVPNAAASSEKLSLARFAEEVTHGTRAILREIALRQAILFSLVEATAGAVAIVATVAYVQDVLGRGETAVAVAMAALGLGSSCAAVVLGRFTGRYEAEVTTRSELHGRRHTWAKRSLLMGGFALGLLLLPGVWVPPLVLLVVLWALNGAGQALIAIASATLLAEHTHDSERGRVYAAHFALTHACWLLTYPGVGHAAAAWGAPVTFTLAGAVCLGTSLFASSQKPSTSAHVHSTPARTPSEHL